MLKITVELTLFFLLLFEKSQKPFKLQFKSYIYRSFEDDDDIMEHRSKLLIVENTRELYLDLNQIRKKRKRIDLL